MWRPRRKNQRLPTNCQQFLANKRQSTGHPKPDHGLQSGEAALLDKYRKRWQEPRGRYAYRKWADDLGPLQFGTNQILSCSATGYASHRRLRPKLHLSRFPYRDKRKHWAPDYKNQNRVCWLLSESWRLWAVLVHARWDKRHYIVIFIFKENIIKKLQHLKVRSCII